jgi:hypothetical protein
VAGHLARGPLSGQTMTSFEKNSDIAGIENEIAILESFRLTAMDLGLGQAESQLRQEVVVRQLTIGKLKSDVK